MTTYAANARRRTANYSPHAASTSLGGSFAQHLKPRRNQLGPDKFVNTNSSWSNGKSLRGLFNQASVRCVFLPRRAASKWISNIFLSARAEAAVSESANSRTFSKHPQPETAHDPDDHLSAGLRVSELINLRSRISTVSASNQVIRPKVTKMPVCLRRSCWNLTRLGSVIDPKPALPRRHPERPMCRPPSGILQRSPCPAHLAKPSHPTRCACFATHLLEDQRTCGASSFCWASNLKTTAKYLHVSDLACVPPSVRSSACPIADPAQCHESPALALATFPASRPAYLARCAMRFQISKSVTS